MAKKKSLIDKVEEMAMEKEIEQAQKDYKIKFPAGWLNVKNANGQIIGIIQNGTKIKGVDEGEKIKFPFDGQHGYVLKSCVEPID